MVVGGTYHGDRSMWNYPSWEIYSRKRNFYVISESILLLR